MIVVIPTARAVDLAYLRPLIDSGARFIVVDDSDGSVSIDHPSFQVFDWSDRARRLGPRDRWFPRRNGACRDFGFYLAWCESDDDEIIVALDDDCEVADTDFGRHVEEALSDRPRHRSAGVGEHWNILDLYDGVAADLYPRGFPYSERVGYTRAELSAEATGPSDFNLGLWQGAFDVNAIDKLAGPAWEHPDARLRAPSTVVPRGTLISVCSMNMQFRRRLIPAAFQFPMHVEVAPGWRIDRYGDIWGGFTLKTLMDLVGDPMTVGEPMIIHRKAGDLHRNLAQEHLAHLVNDEFIALLRAAAGDVQPDGYLGMMFELTEGLSKQTENASKLLRPYLEHLVLSLDAWTRALEEA
jgi:hypothetical protein